MILSVFGQWVGLGSSSTSEYHCNKQNGWQLQAVQSQIEHVAGSTLY